MAWMCTFSEKKTTLVLAKWTQSESRFCQPAYGIQLSRHGHMSNFSRKSAGNVNLTFEINSNKENQIVPPITPTKIFF
jgi:hypothetical protein